jgi:hypothetical protein
LRDDPQPPKPPTQTPNAPVKEPPDSPTTEPDAPVREPGNDGPKKWGWSDPEHNAYSSQLLK